MNEQTDITVYAEVTQPVFTSIEYDPIFLTQTEATTGYVPIDITLGYSGDTEMVVLYSGRTYTFEKTVDPDDALGMRFSGIITKCEAEPEGDFSSNFAPVGSSVYTGEPGNIIIKLSPDCACICVCPSETVTETTPEVTEPEPAVPEETTATEELISDDGIESETEATTVHTELIYDPEASVSVIVEE